MWLKRSITEHLILYCYIPVVSELNTRQIKAHHLHKYKYSMIV